MLKIEATENSPKIAFDEEKKELIIEGESYPENSFSFYKPVFDWMDTRFKELDRLVLKLKVSYMNSSSVKCILDIMMLLDDAYLDGKDVKIIWYYEEENSRSLEMAEDFREDLELPFEILS